MEHWRILHWALNGEFIIFNMIMCIFAKYLSHRLTPKQRRQNPEWIIQMFRKIYIQKSKKVVSIFISYSSYEWAVGAKSTWKGGLRCDNRTPRTGHTSRGPVAEPHSTTISAFPTHTAWKVSQDPPMMLWTHFLCTALQSCQGDTA